MRSFQKIMRERGYLASSVAVLATTLLFMPLRFYVDFAHLAWLYVCVVGLLAWLSGTGPALVAAALSFGAGTYFTPPIGVFWVSKPLDWVQLVVFFAGAAGVGALTAHARGREKAAIESEREATALARLAGEMAQGTDLDSIIENAVSCLMTHPDVRTVIVWVAEQDGLLPRGPGSDSAQGGDRAVAQRAYEHVVAVDLRESARRQDPLGPGWPGIDSEPKPKGLGTFIPLVSAAGNEGVLQVVGCNHSIGHRASSLALAISHLLAVFMSSERAKESAARIQGAEEAARVKSVIVSAVSHELKTPLAAAVAGVTDLASEDVARDSTEVRRGLRSVAEDLERLQAAISDLMDLSRLQAEEWMPHADVYEAGEILGDVVASASSSVRERLVFRVKDRPVAEVHADFAQVSRALRAVLDNAVAYSPPDTPIFLGAERRDDRTVIWIEDRGPGVSDSDKPFVFDRAFRGEAGVRSPGSTGLGLTIARDLVQANRGEVVVEDASPVGSRIIVDLPAEPDEEGRQ